MTREEHLKMLKTMEKLIKQMRTCLESGGSNLQSKIALKRQIKLQEEALSQHKLAYYQLVEGAEPMNVAESGD